MTLAWREAEFGDRRALQAFNCTDPAPREPGRRARNHPRPWEDEVNRSIHALSPPCTLSVDTLLLGFDEEGLAAVALWCELDAMPGWFKIRLIAVERRLRTPGGTSIGKTATEVLNEALRRIKAQGAAVVVGLIDHRNRASQRLCADHGLLPDPAFPVEDPELIAHIARF